jgi:hypothetical protein
MWQTGTTTVAWHLTTTTLISIGIVLSQLLKMLSKSQIAIITVVGSIVVLVYIGLSWFWFYFGWSLGFG